MASLQQLRHLSLADLNEGTLAQDAAFEQRALDLFTFQYENCLPYQAYCQVLRISPDEVNRWQDIPPLPTDAFKFPEHPIRCAPFAEHHFLTSGTTGEQRGVHYFPDFDVYEASIQAGWRELVAPRLPLYFLSQSPASNPQSSLIHMMRVLNNREQAFLIDPAGNFLSAPIRHAKGPLMLFGTALSFIHLMQREMPIPLPQGSALMETGGYKGSGIELDKAEFYKQLSEFFQIAKNDICNEYSMTELSSQTYTRGLGQPHQCPASMRIQVLDPESKKPALPGETGLLVLHDLANIHSCAAIETQDLALFHNSRHFTLMGRDPTALPRGCSRASDELLSR